MSKLIKLSLQNSRNIFRILGVQNIRSYASSGQDKIPVEEKLLNEPMKYFGSGAASWQAKNTRMGRIEAETIWFQPYVVTASIAIFLIYFCWLREESDVDGNFTKNLFDQVDGLEQTQLILAYKYNRDNGIDVSAIEKRLNELGISAESIEVK